MRRFWSFNNVKIRHKLVLSFILVVFVPVIIIGPILAYQLRQLALDNAIEQANTNVERVHKRTAEVLKVPSDISSQLLFDKRLETLVTTRYESTYDVVSAYQDYPVTDNYIRIYKEISNIRFYISNSTLMDNWRIFQIDSRVENSFWYRAALEGRGKIYWYDIEDETKSRSQLSLIRRILDIHTQPDIKALENHVLRILVQFVQEVIQTDRETDDASDPSSLRRESEVGNTGASPSLQQRVSWKVVQKAYGSIF